MQKIDFYSMKKPLLLMDCFQKDDSDVSLFIA